MAEPDADAPVVEVEDLRKAYGSVVAVAGVSLTVRRGEIFALLGPNGAGKTTTVEILEGHRRADSGTVRVLGADPWHSGRRLRERIGTVLQSGGIDGDLTVAETVRLYAHLYPRRWCVADTIDLVGLGQQARDRIHTLSGGQLRRLDLALAVVGDPALIFLDEPTTGFDPSARHQAWDLVVELRRRGKTVILTSHYMDEVQHLADRVAVMSKGRVVAESTPSALGGRDVGQAVICFREPYEGWLSDIPAGPWDRLVEQGGEVRLATTHATEALAALTGWACSHGEELTGLTVTRPSLEDAYLTITGVDERATT